MWRLQYAQSELRVGTYGPIPATRPSAPHVPYVPDTTSSVLPLVDWTNRGDWGEPLHVPSVPHQRSPSCSLDASIVSYSVSDVSPGLLTVSLSVGRGGVRLRQGRSEDASSAGAHRQPQASPPSGGDEEAAVAASRRVGWTRWQDLDFLPYDETHLSPYHRLRYHPLGASAATVLSSTAITRLAVPGEGAGLVVEQTHLFDDYLTTNAMAMDGWGPSMDVVGFSDGTLRLVDWRTPVESRGVALTVAVEPPAWSTPHGRRRGQPRAGLLACCAMDSHFQVVSALADPRGTLVVADLRRAASGRGERRRRGDHGAEAGPRGTSWGTPVCDVRSDGDAGAGGLGLITAAGTAAVTSWGDLESLRGPVRPPDPEPPLPAPGDVAGRAGGGEGAGRAAGRARTLGLRCVWAANGAGLLYTTPAPMGARWVSMRAGGRDEPVIVPASPSTPRQPFVGVASRGALVLLETGAGESLCFEV